MYKVSVVLPVYNSEAMLSRAVDSLQNQSLRDIEIVLVNDASTDNSKTIIDELARHDERIVAIHLDTNCGVHEARLAGLRRCSAPWVGFLDADDYARPTMFEQLLLNGERTGSDIVICGSEITSKQGQRLGTKIRFKAAETATTDIFKRFCGFEFGTGTLWNKLFKKELIQIYEDCHFRWRQNINEDLLVNIGCFYRAKRVHLLPDILHEYVEHGMSVTHSPDPARAYVDTFRAFALAMDIAKGFNSRAVEQVINMYRRQLSWRIYQLADVGELAQFEHELTQGVELINEINPALLGKLSARTHPTYVPIGFALKSIKFRLKQRILALIKGV